MSLIRLWCATVQVSCGSRSLWEPADPSLQRRCTIMQMPQMPRDSATACKSPNAQKIYCNAAARGISAESPGIRRGPLCPSRCPHYINSHAVWYPLTWQCCLNPLHDNTLQCPQVQRGILQAGKAGQGVNISDVQGIMIA